MFPFKCLAALTIYLVTPAALPVPTAYQVPSKPSQYVEEPLGEIGEDALDKGGWEISPDGSRLAWRERRDKKWVMIVNGKPDPAFDDVSLPIFSPDGKRMAYAVESNNKWKMIVDGAAGPEFDHLAERQQFRGYRGVWGNAKDPLVWFSPNGKHVIYIAKRGKKWFAVVDGREGPAYDELLSPFFSPDGERIAFAAQQAGQWRMVVDGKEQTPGFDEIRTPGQIGTPSFRPGVFSPRFSQDGQRIGYVARRKSDMIAVLGEKEVYFVKGSGFWTGLPGCVTASADLRRYGIVRKNTKGDRWAIELDGQPVGETDEPACIVFSPDSRHTAYINSRVRPGSNEKSRDCFVVMDGRESPSFDGVLVLTFSPDNSVVYLAGKVTGEEGKQKMKVFEVKGETMREVTEQGILQMPTHAPAFSPDGQRVAFLLTDSFHSLGFWGQVWKTRPILASRKGQLRIFLDGKPFGKEYSLPSLYGPTTAPFSGGGASQPVFSPDGRHLAFVINDHDHDVARGGAYGMVVVNGQDGKAYTEVFSDTLRFPSANTVVYVARADRRFYRVTQAIPEP